MPVELTASAFIAAIGVNAAISFTNTPYANAAEVISAMRYLGLSTLRDITPDPACGPTWSAYNAIASADIKFDFIAGVGGALDLSAVVSSLHAFTQQSPGKLIAIEGPNELNLWPVTYSGFTDTYSAGAHFTQDLSAAAKADPLLSSTPIYAPTLGVDSSGEAKLGSLSRYVTYGNAHVYGARGYNTWTNDMPYWLAIQQKPTLGKQTVITETGYSTIPNQPGTDNVNALTAAKLNLNTLFDNASNGIAMTYLYELVDGNSAASDVNAEDHYGEFNSNWTPKIGATAIHNLITILNASGSGEATTHLHYTISGLPGTARSIVLASSRAFDLAVWNDANIWNATAAKEVRIAPATATVNLGVIYPEVDVFDPLTGSSPIAIYTNTNKAQIQITDHPLIVKILVDVTFARNPGAALPATGMPTP